VTARRILLLLALGVLVLTAVGCGDDGPDGTGTTSPAPTCTVSGSDPVTFGEGEIPSSIPGEFPVPDGAVVGSTLVDRVNHRSEFAFTLARDATNVVEYYTLNLVSAGFVVDSSEGDTVSWRIEFSRGGVRGDMVIQPEGSGLTAVVASFNTC
jgi:hypothetical protein